MHYSLNRLIQILSCVVYSSLYYIYYFVHTSDRAIYINYIGILKLRQKRKKMPFQGVVESIGVLFLLALQAGNSHERLGKMICAF